MSPVHVAEYINFYSPLASLGSESSVYRWVHELLLTSVSPLHIAEYLNFHAPLPSLGSESSAHGWVHKLVLTSHFSWKCVLCTSLSTWTCTHLSPLVEVSPVHVAEYINFHSPLASLGSESSVHRWVLELLLTSHFSWKWVLCTSLSTWTSGRTSEWRDYACPAACKVIFCHNKGMLTLNSYANTVHTVGSR